MNDPKRQVQEQFGAAADAYVTSTTHSDGEDLRRIGQLAAEVAGRQRALDVATGGGHTARQLAPLFALVVPYDLTGPMLEAAQRALRGWGVAHAQAVQGDAEALPFADGSFDGVSCRIAPHHFPHPERFVREVARVLRPGGRFLLVDSIVPTNEEAARWLNRVEALRDPSHGRTLSVVAWLDLLSDSRLRIGGHESYSKRHDLEPWLARMNASEAQRAAVHQAFRHAPASARSALHLEYDADETPLAYTDEKVLIWADR